LRRHEQVPGLIGQRAIGLRRVVPTSRAHEAGGPGGSGWIGTAAGGAMAEPGGEWFANGMLGPG
jgi:hypothetical protein